MANSKIDSLDNPIAIIQQAIDLIQNARQKIVRQSNSLMVFTYFQIGQLIVEQEQKGKQKAAYCGEDGIPIELMNILKKTKIFWANGLKP